MAISRRKERSSGGVRHVRRPTAVVSHRSVAGTSDADHRRCPRRLPRRPPAPAAVRPASLFAPERPPSAPKATDGGEGGDKHRAKHSLTHSRLRPHLKVSSSPVRIRRWLIQARHGHTIDASCSCTFRTLGGGDLVTNGTKADTSPCGRPNCVRKDARLYAQRSAHGTHRPRGGRARSLPDGVRPPPPRSGRRRTGCARYPRRSRWPSGSTPSSARSPSAGGSSIELADAFEPFMTLSAQSTANTHSITVLEGLDRINSALDLATAQCQTEMLTVQPSGRRPEHTPHPRRWSATRPLIERGVRHPHPVPAHRPLQPGDAGLRGPVRRRQGGVPHHRRTRRAADHLRRDRGLHPDARRPAGRPGTPPPGPRRAT